MLAMVVNDDAGHLAPHGALRFFASMLAPTSSCVHLFHLIRIFHRFLTL